MTILPITQILVFSIQKLKTHLDMNIWHLCGISNSFSEFLSAEVNMKTYINTQTAFLGGKSVSQLVNVLLVVTGCM